MNPSEEVLHFWFQESTPQQWFKKDPAFDELIRVRFAGIHALAAAGEYFTWRETAHGRLAEIIVLDQFSRNLYRHDARAFACDAMALVLAQEAVAAGHDQLLNLTERAFLYMPYMHSESVVIHQKALRLFATPGLETNYDFEKRHLAILERFGRYPHRNLLLGRVSTPEEVEFLKEDGSSF